MCVWDVGSPHWLMEADTGTNGGSDSLPPGHRWDQPSSADLAAPVNLWEVVGVVWIHFRQLFKSLLPFSHLPFSFATQHIKFLCFNCWQRQLKRQTQASWSTGFHCLKPQEDCVSSSTVSFHSRTLFALHVYGGLPSFSVYVAFYQAYLPSLKHPPYPIDYS